MTRVLKSYTLTIEEGELIKTLADAMTDGNRSRLVGEAVRRLAEDSGMMQIPHAGVPLPKFASSDGKPRCNPEMARGLCRLCYPNGVVQ